MILSSEVPLTPGFPEGFEDGPSETAVQYQKNLYEWTAGTPGTSGTLALANILPDKHPATVDGRLSALGAVNENVRNAVSADGSRVVFESSEPGGNDRHLYVRDLALGQTVQLDMLGEGVITARCDEEPCSWTRRDASRVFFTDTERLTGAPRRKGARTCTCVRSGRGRCALVCAEGPDGSLKNRGTSWAPISVSTRPAPMSISSASGVLAPGAVAGEDNLTSRTRAPAPPVSSRRSPAKTPRTGARAKNAPTSSAN